MLNMFSSDYTRAFYGCIAMWTFLSLWCGDFTEAGKLEGYLVVAPAVLVRNSTAKVCCTFHNLHEDVNIRFQLRALRRKETHVQNEVFSGAENRCIDLQIPDTINNYKAELTTTAKVIGRNYEIFTYNPRRELRVVLKNHLMFIQPDKPIYRPGQTVRIRILVLDLKLKPRQGEVPEVWLYNGEGFRVAQWDNLPLKQGLAELEFPLSESTSTGVWKLYASIDDQNTYKKFKVEHYVLPRFQVTVDVPPRITLKDQYIELQICANYRYGKSVSGNFTLCADYGKEQECEEFVSGEIHGCTKAGIPTGNQLVSGVHVYANVTEKVTGTVMESAKSFIEKKVEKKGIKFISSSPMYFKPGLPYIGQAKVYSLSKIPLDGIQVKIEVTYAGKVPDAIKGGKYTNNYLTDDQGIASFRLPELTDQVDRFEIKVEIVETGVTDEITIRRWYSPTNSFLQLSPADTSGCTTSHTINYTVLLMKTKQKKLKVDLNLFVLSAGNIHHMQKEKIHLKEGESDSADENPNFSSKEISIGSAIESRRYLLYWVNLSIIPNPSEHLGHHGHVVGWSFYSKRDQNKKGHMFLQIWRPVSSRQGQKYQLIGQKKVYYHKPGHYEVRLMDYEQIAVEPKDVIGIYFPRRNTIPFDKIRNCSQNKKAMWRQGKSKSSHDIYDFQTFSSGHWIPCRRYSLQAIIQPEIKRASRELSLKSSLVVSLGTYPPPNSKLLAYLVTEEGETVADSISLGKELCLSNDVHFQYDSNKRYPGETVSYSVKASSGSLCSLVAVDKSVSFLQKLSSVNAEDVSISLNQSFDLTPKKQRLCGNQGALDHYDSIDAFDNAGAMVISNTAVETTPCPSFGRIISDPPFQAVREPSLLLPRPSADMAVENIIHDLNVGSDIPMDMILEDNSGEAVVENRFLFPETWLWETFTIGESGEARFTKSLPHSITDWKTSAFCVDNTTGLGIATEATLRAFQPFFITFQLPPSIKVSESLVLEVFIFSYLDECVEIMLMFEAGDGIGNLEGQTQQFMCICNQDTRKVKFIIQGIQIGIWDLQFKATTDHYNSVCPQERSDLYRISAIDTITKSLNVKSEGVEEDYMINTILTPEDKYPMQVDIPLPDTVIPGSLTVEVRVTGDVMSPSIEGIDNLIKRPSGCGEQNMIHFAPMVSVMEYLYATEQMEGKLKRKLLQNLARGYQTQLRFKKDDGSYSAFGLESEEGSIWLTAFVLRSFAKARQYSEFVNINDRELLTSQEWIRSHQQRNTGCFPALGMVHDPNILGGVGSSTNSTALTAYVVAALLEAESSVLDPLVHHSILCLHDNIDEDTYTLALKAYAYTLYEPEGTDRKLAIEKLMSRAISTGGTLHWEHNPYSGQDEDKSYNSHAHPLDIEISAYVLMSVLTGGTEDEIINGSGIVRWLVQQQNDFGGFSSTQDSVVAIQALAKFARFTHAGQELDMQIHITTEDGTRELNVTNDNKELLQKIPILVSEKTNNHFNYSINGTGTALFQIHVHYNTLLIPKPKAHFTLDHIVLTHPGLGGECPEFDCFEMTLKICTKYIGDREHSSMALLDIEMASGWAPVRQLESQINTTGNSHHMVEVKDRRVYVYFSKLNSEETCVHVPLEEAEFVYDRVDAYIKVYEYNGNMDNAASLMYTVEEVCTEEEKEVVCFTEMPALSFMEGNYKPWWSTK